MSVFKIHVFEELVNKFIPRKFQIEAIVDQSISDRFENDT